MPEEVRYDRNMKSRPGEIVRELFLPWAIAAAYAATDEFHQLFVPGRSGQLSDVILDSAGALAGVAAFTVLCWLINRRKARVS